MIKDAKIQCNDQTAKPRDQTHPILETSVYIRVPNTSTPRLCKKGPPPTHQKPQP